MKINKTSAMKEFSLDEAIAEQENIMHAAVPA
jgi:hypothetical protein